LPAHRRSAPQGATTSRRRPADPRGRRRAGSAPHRGLPLILGIGLLGVGVLAGPSVVGNGWNPTPGTDDRKPITLAALPNDAPELGLVYSGLGLAGRNSPCAGAYELAEPATCSHGPDSAPPGLKVARDVPAVTGPVAEPRTPSRESGQAPSDGEIVRDQGGTALAAGRPALIADPAPGEADFVMGSHDVACEGDGRTGKRVQVLYLHEFGTASRYTEYVGSIRSWAAGVDGIVDASAGETGGSRHVRYVTTPQCRVDVAEVQVPKNGLGSFSNTMTALEKLGYNRADRKYLLFADTNVYCGIATFIADSRAGQGNRNNAGPSYGRVDAGCWSAGMAAHELTHTLGGIGKDAPHANGTGHCTDGNDLLCSREAGAKVTSTCTDKQSSLRLDCNHDDYFHTAPKAGSYLAQNWNVAQSEFLLRSDGGEDTPGAPSIPAKKPSTPATVTTSSVAATIGTDATTAPGELPPTDPAVATESPETTPSGGAVPVTPAPVETDDLAEPVQAVLETREVTSTSVRLRWSASAPAATYTVVVDGATIATTTSTRARLIGLAPGTRYRVTITDSSRGYAAKAEAQTAPGARPAENSWFVLTNSLTGGAADLYAARSAIGTPIVLNGAEGGAQQQWKLVPAENGDGSVSLQSRATGKCLAPQSGNQASGAPLVQADCAADDGGQRFRVETTDHGFSLRTASGGLVVGVGSQRFGAHRVLVLQQADGVRHQSWTALPG
jgi:hypothetical protein